VNCAPVEPPAGFVSETHGQVNGIRPLLVEDYVPGEAVDAAIFSYSKFALPSGTSAGLDHAFQE
jgi:hypothetical protein